jgi:DNA mismatch repair protein MutS2
LAAGQSWARGTEWTAVLSLLADEARTPMGRDRVLGAEPLTDVAAVVSALEATDQARRALAVAGLPPLDAVPDVRPVLDRARPEGAILDGGDLRLLVPVLDTPTRVGAWSRELAPDTPGVTAAARALPRLDDLAGRLRETLDDEGGLRDEASPRLGILRRDLRERRRRIVADLERLLQGEEATRLFADRYVTVRHGRYVLPLRAEARGRLRGIVHDRSQSGQTLFIEPEGLVEANNDLVQAVRAEEEECLRLLAELTGAVRARFPEVDRLVSAIADLDRLFAFAAVAERMGATRPTVEAGGPVRLRAARHPLLVAQAWRDPARPVVPADIELDVERPLLLITGPNAGGKTIALKTLALQAALAQIGCHVPAGEGSRLPVFAEVFAVVGDEQSVAENLSTFSAFVGQVREILARVGPRSLVLLDELGAGTDPDEGAALARAILEALAERGALVVATTHLEPLKVFAGTDPRARNASVEFDPATLAPTFRLRYDQPGASYALTIAARLGLDPALIARAHTHRGEQARHLAALLERLDSHARTEAEAREAIERACADAAAHLAAARQAEETARSRARELVERAKAEASRLLTDVRRALAAEWDALKRTEKSRQSLERTRARLAAVGGALAAAGPAAEAAPAPDPATLVPGATVAADHLGVRGELLEVTGSTAVVRSGAITVRVPVQALRPTAAVGRDGRAGAVGSPARARVVNGAGTAPARDVGPELLLLGRTTDEVRGTVEKYLDDAFLAGLPTVRLVHGKGTGALRRAVRDLLAAHPLVESFRDGEPSEGGAGATVAVLKVG